MGLRERECLVGRQKVGTAGFGPSRRCCNAAKRRESVSSGHTSRPSRAARCHHILRHIRHNIRHVHLTCGGSNQITSCFQSSRRPRPHPQHPRHMLAQPIRLRSLGSWCPPLFAPHYVAWKASRCRRFIGDAHGSRVFVSPMMEHRANQTVAASVALVECNAHLTASKAKFAKSKVSSLLFLLFRCLRKFDFADLAFCDLSIR
jgi:hypothetical protein